MSEKELSLDVSVYKEVFKLSPQGISIISDKGVYLDVNKNFANLLGYSSAQDLIGKSIQEVTHPDDYEMDREMTEKIFSGQIDSFELDKRFLKKNGDVTWLKLHAKTHQGLGIGILEPISERIQLEGRIAKLKQDLDQFIYRVSHDIRTPVVNILGLTSLTYKSENEAEELLIKTRESAKKLDHIIHEIADYAHNKKFPIRNEEVNLANLIEEICNDSLKERTNEKQIDIEKKVSYFNGVKIDHSRLNIVLKNLIANSLAFGKKNGHTLVSADVKDSQLVLKIKDDGMGIRQDIQAKIYDMFFRGSNISEGAGLGLFIVKDILKEINGEISFTSEEGSGTEFIVRIPLNN